MKKWLPTLLLLTAIFLAAAPTATATVTVECSLDQNVTWRNVTSVYQDQHDALMAGVAQDTQICCRAKNETTSYSYACARTKEGLDSMGITLTLGVGIVAALMFWFSFKLDAEHFILRLLLIFSAMTMLILIPVSTFAPDNIGVTFYRVYLYVFVAFWLYIGGYGVWYIMKKMRNDIVEGGDR